MTSRCSPTRCSWTRAGSRGVRTSSRTRWKTRHSPRCIRWMRRSEGSSTASRFASRPPPATRPCRCASRSTSPPAPSSSPSTSRDWRRTPSCRDGRRPRSPSRPSATIDRGGVRSGRRPRDGRSRMTGVDWVLLIGRVIVVFVALLLSVLLYIWMERKVIADIQTRIGPMRAGPRGVLVTFADGIKLFFKESIRPTQRRPSRLPPGAGPRDDPRVPGVLGDPVRRAGHDLRSHGSLAARRSQHRRALGARDDLDRRVRRGPRRVVERLELSAARRGSLDGPDGQLRGRDVARAGRRDHVQRPPEDVGDRGAAGQGLERRSRSSRRSWCS